MVTMINISMMMIMMMLMMLGNRIITMTKIENQEMDNSK